MERLVCRLRWYGLPAAVVGFWTDGGWQLDGVIEPERQEAELEADLSAA